MCQHPGKKIEQLLKTNNMSQKELALRTGVTEKHISTLINGEKNISLSFSKKLEYVFILDNNKTFFDLQNQYDSYIHLKEEENNISNEEKKIFEQLKEPFDYLVKNNNTFVSENNSSFEKIIALRKFLQISNLCLLPALSQNIFFRMKKNTNTTINQNVLYMWVKICESFSNRYKLSSIFDSTKLKNSLPLLKKAMFLNSNQYEANIFSIFSKCGILFKIVPNFTGAPVQGFIEEVSKDKLIMCVTTRGKRADIFWFTIFHEIAHILNGDYQYKMVDLVNSSSDKETKADILASNVIMNQNNYQNFINEYDYSIDAIDKFAKSEKIPMFMVIGKMQKDNIIEYSQYYDKIPILNIIH